MTSDETQIRKLYQAWLDRWNKRNAAQMAELCSEQCHVTGFDGSPMNGRSEIGTVLGKIFADHQTAPYVAIVREVRFLVPEVAVLRAVAGMPLSGQADINPAVNAIQTLIAAKRQGKWQIELVQTTPAAFHGRPDLSEQLTEDLRQALRASSSAR